MSIMRSDIAVAKTKVDRGSPWGTPSAVWKISSSSSCGIATERLQRFLVARNQGSGGLICFFSCSMHALRCIVPKAFWKSSCAATWVGFLWRCDRTLVNRASPPCGTPTPNWMFWTSSLSGAPASLRRSLLMSLIHTELISMGLCPPCGFLRQTSLWACQVLAWHVSGWRWAILVSHAVQSAGRCGNRKTALALSVVQPPTSGALLCLSS